MKSRNVVKWLLVMIIAFSFISQNAIAMDARVIKMSGEVKVRRGVEEFWQPASLGVFLKNIDTILTGENGEVLLEIQGGYHFHLGPNSILDIADMRKISEQELFLYLMREKVSKVEKRTQKTPIRIGNVSVVHGSYQDTVKEEISGISDELRERVKNGIRALFTQEFYPNTILKIHDMINNYHPSDDCGELHYYLGSSFEALNKPGQAMESYEAAIEISKASGCSSSKWVLEANQGIDRLKP